MSRIAQEAESLLQARQHLPLGLSAPRAATEMTVAVTQGAMHAAEQLNAKLLVLLTRSGTTASAVSALRSRIPIVALTDNVRVASRLTLNGGVHGLVSDVCGRPVQEIARFVHEWGRGLQLLTSGDRVVVVGATDWTAPG